MDFSHIEHRTIIVGVEIVAHINVLAEIAVEVVAHKGTDAHMAKQLFHYFLLLGKIE